uniref:Cytohesin 3 n=2 Tax=Sus scrofa TaxID=9823 RepID=A0A4X1TW65_PIG
MTFEVSCAPFLIPFSSFNPKMPEDLSLEEREELSDIRRRKKELIDDIERLKYEIAEVMTEIDNLTSVEESKTTQRNKQIAMGRKKFNMDPKKGIQFLIENDLLQSSPEDVAQFLYKGEGLNKTVIGDYLGERDEFNIKVLQAFVELHEFADLNLVQALRQFLWSFRLPGEAQKIDRMMEAFASRYCLCNPGVFQSTDTCYVLSFAIIMLNTSLHNHNVRDKPTAERFVTMNRGINEGGDLPEELLRNLYESIKNEPFKIPEDDGNDLTHTFFNPDREGWLLKLGERRRRDPSRGPCALGSSPRAVPSERLPDQRRSIPGPARRCRPVPARPPRPSCRVRRVVPGCTQCTSQKTAPLASGSARGSFLYKRRRLDLREPAASLGLVWLIFDAWFKCAFLLFSFCLWLPPFCSVTGCPCLFCVRRYVPSGFLPLYQLLLPLAFSPCPSV